MSSDKEYGAWNPYTYSPPDKDYLLQKVEDMQRVIRGMQYELNIIKAQIQDRQKEEALNEHS